MSQDPETPAPPDQAVAKSIACRVEPAERRLVERLAADVHSPDGRGSKLSVVVRAIVLPVLERVDRILAVPMPAGATLRDRIELVLERGLKDEPR